MNKQFVVVVSREYGSGGHEIAENLSKRLGIGFYDRNILDEIAEEQNVDSEQLRKYDEIPKNSLLSRKVLGYSNSPEEVIANMQFEYMRKKVNSGESFVIVGRCADIVLKEYKNLITVFVLGDEETKAQRIAKIRNMSISQAKATMIRHDKKRKSYHNYYSNLKWGDSRGYDISINSSRQGIEKTIDILEDYIKMRLQLMNDND